MNSRLVLRGGSAARATPSEIKRRNKPRVRFARMAWLFCNPFDPQNLRPFPAGAAAGFREVEPVVFPIAGNSREQSAMRRHAFVRTQGHAAAIDDDQFAHGL